MHRDNSPSRIRLHWQIGCLRLEVVSPAADGVTGHPEHCQDGADHQHNNADGPDNGDLRDEPDNDQDDAENDQLWLLAVVTIVSPCLTAPYQSCWEETGQRPCRSCRGPEQRL